MRRETKITAFASFFFLTFFFLHQVMTKPTGQRSEKMKIGFIYDGDESIPNTNNFIRSQHLLEEQYNDEISIIVRNNVSPDQIEAAIDEMAREKCSIIFTTSYAHSIVAKIPGNSNLSGHWRQCTGRAFHQQLPHFYG